MTILHIIVTGFLGLCIAMPLMFPDAEVVEYNPGVRV